MRRLYVPLFLLTALILSSCSTNAVKMSDKVKKWHKMTLTFNGPETSESAATNPFLDYRLNVTFTQGEQKFVVPGFYAANGDAAETSAMSGKKWQVRFRPNAAGKWQYEISFRTGKYIAVSDDIEAGEPLDPNGQTGTFTVDEADTDGPFSKGKLRYVGERYLQFESGDYFLKAGADSPENFLAFNDFDGTYYAGDGKRRLGEAGPNEDLHTYEPHAGDWREGDPTWQGGKGKNIIGALNYLASKGMNSVYFLTQNFHGDGKDVWPWIDPFERTRYDCSKLDQWEIVFDHMDKLGIMLHVVTQETENELLLDNGYTGVTRKLYYRELIARFGHHLAVTWNLGEENGYAHFTPNAQNDDMRRDMATWIKAHDPYSNFVALHTHAGQEARDKILQPLLGFEYIDGPSLQIGNAVDVHRATIKWIDASAEAGKQWVCFLDEIGDAQNGVLPDADDPKHDLIRKNVLWGNLMAGGAGCEWYFGYKWAHNDLNCEDWRSRENMWDQTRYAVEFFQQHTPFTKMNSAGELVSAKQNWCLAAPGKAYVVYLPNGGSTKLKLASGDYEVKWYNTRQGGELEDGTVKNLSGPGWKKVGLPPDEISSDWAAVIISRK